MTECLIISILGVAALISQLDNWTVSNKNTYWDTTITKNLSPTSYPVGLSFGLIYSGKGNGYPEDQGAAITCINSTTADYCYGGQICIFSNCIIVRSIYAGNWTTFKKIDLVDA